MERAYCLDAGIARACPKTTILGSLSAAFVANFVEFWKKSGVVRQSLRQRLPTKLNRGQALANETSPHLNPLHTSMLIMVLAAMLSPCAFSAPVLPAPKRDSASATNYWAFEPPVQPAAPTVKQKQWPRAPLDRFI